MALTWILAELVPAIRLKDAVVFYDATRLDHPPVGALGEVLLALLDPPLFVLWGLLLVLVALRAGRRRLALAVALVLALAPLSAELLKPLLAHQHDWVGGAKHLGPASWPSGHATAATTLVMCVALVVPVRRRRAALAAGAAFALAVGAALVLLARHVPSDVLGGYLLATLWVALAVAILRLTTAHRVAPTATTPI
jgi:membrane-associated phospholipid phosphatase